MIGGGLFSQYFLGEKIAESDAWTQLTDADTESFAALCRDRLTSFAAFRNPSEAETEQELIFPLLDALGWTSLPQQSATTGRRTDVPDALLFLDEATKTRAKRLPQADRLGVATVVVENKAWGVPLDRRTGAGESTPSSQMLRYLNLALARPNAAVRWGLLTDGRLWRLYWAGARARHEGYVELDLPALLEPTLPPQPGGHGLGWLRVFVLLFRRDAFVPSGPSARGFLDDALNEGRRHEARITDALSAAVFDKAFPALVDALAEGDPARDANNAGWRREVKETALSLLFRLLFLLYAEDRDLLPVEHPGYRPNALRTLRNEAQAIADGGAPLSARARTWWPRLRALFEAVAAGDAAMGLPPYNGGLFNDDAHPILARVRIPDATLAAILDDLSREGNRLARRYINYRDLSVQKLGSIYERLLERDVVAEGARVATRLNPYARKNSGSYYTPDELVGLILRRTLGPLLAERREAFADASAAMAPDRRPKPERLAYLERFDPATAFLELRVLDPAMGSGHFLVSLVDFLADETLAAMEEAAAQVKWAEPHRPYRSPLADRIAAVRGRIEGEARAHGWSVRPVHLDDKAIVRRIILKRVVYGVDLNPMAVELAKLSLWLGSFTVGAPLSFLDHHLRCGDSLFGELVRPVEDELAKRGSLFLAQSVAAARGAAAGMATVEGLSDADIAEVGRSKAAFADVEDATAPLRTFLDVVHAARWLALDGKTEEGRAYGALLDGSFGDPVKVVTGVAAPTKGSETELRALAGLLARVRALQAERRFLHWEPAFPGVWDDWSSNDPAGGFDAVIGNPPWDRIRLEAVEWFAARDPAIARLARASDRKRGTDRLRRGGGDLARDFERAEWAAETAARVARAIGHYPLLSGGDANLYALFVERALRLVKPAGLVGLLVPSGIAADKGASRFFRSVAESGRLGVLFDFENRRPRHDLDPFFPDIDTRFKFTALVVAGARRRFEAARCAFFKQSVAEAEREAFTLGPADFSLVNPNTGTAPVFRSERDAALTVGIYRRLPVLVDRRTEPPKTAWPTRYLTMFHMTNDSALFRTSEELTGLGASRVAHDRWTKGDQGWVPLYEGKMAQAFDHRAASVTVNPLNLHRPGQPRAATPAEHADPSWLPEPQFWVETCALNGVDRLAWMLGFKDVTAPTNRRTMIAAMLPRAGFGNTLPLVLPAEAAAAGARSYARFAPLLLANLNSVALDFVARQKVQGQHLNWYIVEQLPVLPPAGFERRVGATRAEEMVRDAVLRLTYTSHDMRPFAADQGYTGQPFAWDEEERLHLRARLDALFFLLYGLDREEARYVLGTFPIVADEERAAYGGRFRSLDLILGYMAAFEAGDTDSRVAA